MAQSNKQTLDSRLEPLLLNAKQVEQLIGDLDIRTIEYLDGFPKQVNVGRIARRLWRYADIKNWVENLYHKPYNRCW